MDHQAKVHSSSLLGKTPIPLSLVKQYLISWIQLGGLSWGTDSSYNLSFVNPPIPHNSLKAVVIHITWVPTITQPNKRPSLDKTHILSLLFRLKQYGFSLQDTKHTVQLLPNNDRLALGGAPHPLLNVVLVFWTSSCVASHLREANLVQKRKTFPFIINTILSLWHLTKLLHNYNDLNSN